MIPAITMTPDMTISQAMSPLVTRGRLVAGDPGEVVAEVDQHPETVRRGQRRGQGTEVCADHVPGRPGGKQLLIVNGPLSSAMLAGIR